MQRENAALRALVCVLLFKYCGLDWDGRCSEMIPCTQLEVISPNYWQTERILLE